MKDIELPFKLNLKQKPKHESSEIFQRIEQNSKDFQDEAVEWEDEISEELKGKESETNDGNPVIEGLGHSANNPEAISMAILI